MAVTGERAYTTTGKHMHRRAVPLVCPVAQCACALVSPHPHRATALLRATLRTPSPTGPHAAEPDHLHGRVGKKEVVPTKGFPPGPDRPVAFQCQTLQEFSGNGRHAGEPAHRHRRVDSIRRGRGERPVTQLPATVQTPSRY